MTMVSCPEEGRLRAYLDGELAGTEQEAVARHIDGCGECAGRAEALGETAGAVGDVLASFRPWGVGEPDAADARAALARFESRRRAGEGRQGRAAWSPASWFETPRRRPAAAIAAAALILALLVGLAPMQSFAQQLSNIFRVQQFAAVTVPVPGMNGVPSPESLTDADKAQLVTMLSSLGRLETQATPQNVREVDSLDKAREHYGATLRALPDNKLPQGFAGKPVRYAVSDPMSAQYTLYTAVAKQYAGMARASAPQSPDLAGLLPDVPELTFKLDVPAAVAMAYGDEMRGFGVVQLASPTLTIPKEIDVVAARAVLLAMPGLPEDTVAQLRGIKDEDLDKTLIIPVPQDAKTEQVTIDGNAGILIADGQGRGVVVIWQNKGTLYAAGGNLSRDEILAIARNLE
jgi:anti-sigma factor RsiW